MTDWRDHRTTWHQLRQCSNFVCLSVRSPKVWSPENSPSLLTDSSTYQVQSEQSHGLPSYVNKSQLPKAKLSAIIPEVNLGKVFLSIYSNFSNFRSQAYNINRMFRCRLLWCEWLLWKCMMKWKGLIYKAQQFPYLVVVVIRNLFASGGGLRLSTSYWLRERRSTLKT